MKKTRSPRRTPVFLFVAAYCDVLMATFPDLVVRTILLRVSATDRVNVMLACRRFHDLALRFAWPPWEKGGRGLFHACAWGHVDYYRR